MIDFLEKYWTYILTGGTVFAFIYDKARNYRVERKKKQVAYNRFFSAILKLYFSYLKHKMIYAEKAPLDMPDEFFVPMVKLIDTFNEDVEDFKKSVSNGAEIIPEIIMQTNFLFDTIDRLRIVDKVNETSILQGETISDKDRIPLKRAMFYTLEEIFEEFFISILTTIHKHTTVKKAFLKEIFSYGSKKYLKELENDQRKLLKRYFESLNRQGCISKEMYVEMMKQL